MTKKVPFSENSRVVFHLPKKSVENYRKRPFLEFFSRCEEVLRANKIQVEVRVRSQRLTSPLRADCSDILEAENLHIIEGGNVHQSNALNTTMAYLKSYFHLDSHGVLAKSSASFHAFDETLIDESAALTFWENLQDRFVRPRYSRYNQPEKVKSSPSQAIAVFLQGDFPQKQRTAYCDSETMLRTVAKYSGGRPVVVKAHPNSRIMDDAEMIFSLMLDGVNLQPTDTNIHDILASCDVTVSHNSAVAIEGFMHRKPAILFGSSDFHHISHTVKDPDEFELALSRALASKADYSRFLFWYFSKFCISTNDPKFDEKILTRFGEVGFVLE